MTLTWHGAVCHNDVANVGPLALIHPLLQKLDLAGIIDRHLPADPQLECSYGKVLSLLVAARLSEPTALVNVADWADKTGADIASAASSTSFSRSVTPSSPASPCRLWAWWTSPSNACISTPRT